MQTITLKHHVTPEHVAAVERGPFYFCRTPACDVVNFNTAGVVLYKPDVRQRIGLKETEDPVPLCYCFGFTEAWSERKSARRAAARFRGTLPPKPKRKLRLRNP